MSAMESKRRRGYQGRPMTYEDVEFVIRAGLGRNEWTLLIYYPDNAA